MARANLTQIDTPLLRKLDQFRGDALFTTWARRFAALEVPGEIRRRLGHGREAPTDSDYCPAERSPFGDPERRVEASELARTVGHLIAHELTAHQREVLLALTIDEVAVKDLAARLDSTPGALYKTVHDARRKLKLQLDDELQDHDHPAITGIGLAVRSSRMTVTPAPAGGPASGDDR